MPQVTKTNNENEFRLTRSKVQHQESISTIKNTTISNSQHKQQTQQQISSPPQVSVTSSEGVSHVNTRQYLGDVSNQYITNAKPTNKRKPLGGDNAPLQKQQHRPSRPIPIASDNNNNGSTSSSSNSSNNNNNDANRLASLAVPSRLPQKRQATESSTNLVEKLRVPQPEVGERSQSYHKKSRLIDYEWQDLDEEDNDDQLMVSEYVNEIFSYYYELETRMLPDPQYLFKQTLLKPRMRSILVDWLVEMHLKFKLLPESLFLAVNVMDRFMSVEVVQIDKLQLLATAALFTAAKNEEVFSPSVKNYAYFTDGSYTPEEVVQAEKYMLTILNFDLNYPNPMNFLRRISKADDYDVQSRTLGKYLLEITIVDYKFIGMRPSLCCASAMYLARLILGKLPVWNGNLIHYSGGYRISDMRECIELMFQYLIAPIEHDEFFKKYAMRKFMRASTLCRNWAKKFQASGRDLFDERLSTHRLTLEDDDEEEEIVVAEAEE
uniref:G2/mitotic-specific cyclin CYB1 n=1 Tax=Candida albicans TaxID=5476 RepID=CG21_CANAX|nr:RecName: Full=G2/mitotic-specific cyclin CYB1 [Candida albicans]AAC49451.1 Cyb1 [Candida albicans]